MINKGEDFYYEYAKLAFSEELYKYMKNNKMTIKQLSNKTGKSIKFLNDLFHDEEVEITLKDITSVLYKIGKSVKWSFEEM